MKSYEDYPIDIVIPWVDSNDENWTKIKEKYMNHLDDTPNDSRDIRYRDWDTLKYLFRGIDEYAPWVRKVHLVTMGQKPDWIDVNNKKLSIVDHRDYIPEKYLPTFSSHTIELNIHRIKDLAEHFIYFNDDILILKNLKRSDFFEKGMPKDAAVHTALTSSHRESVMDVALTNIEIINEHFKKKQVMKQNFIKWFNLLYGKQLIKTICLLPWERFSDIQTWHSCVPFCKSTFEEVWDLEYEKLNSTCMHKFRTSRDVNQWLIRDWQLVSGNFIPKRCDDSHYYGIGNCNDGLVKDLLDRKYKIVCINDNGVEQINDFAKTKKELISALDCLFPNKSSYEK